jgi:hypothetical protein
MTLVVIGLSCAYAAVALLLGLVVLSTRIPILVRIISTLSVVALAFFTYWGISEIRGLPSDSYPPHLFRMHWARIVEPNKMTDEPGSIFLWLETLDEDNYPSGLPRAYRLPFTPELADAVQAALASIAEGEEVAGQIEEDIADLETSERLALEITADEGGNTNSTVGERVVPVDFGDISFRPLPAPETPEKTN